MTEIKRSVGESLFEQYLGSQGLNDWDFEKGHPDKNKHPDYTVRIDREYLFDVKEFEPRFPLAPVGFYDPYSQVRGKIDEGRKKFKEYKDHPCCVVLYNNGNAPLVDLTSWEVLFGAMLGDIGFSIPFDPNNLITKVTGKEAVKRGFLDRGKMHRPKTRQPQNTTISALITLRHVRVGRRRLQAHMEALKRQGTFRVEDWFDVKVDFDTAEAHLGVIVWENPFSRIPFPRHLFCGPYDERYGLEGDRPVRLFVGDEISKLERLTTKNSAASRMP